MSTSSFADGSLKAADALRPGLFRGRQALITGGTSGIGAAIAEGFLALGASVLATGATDTEIHAARQLPAIKGRSSRRLMCATAKPSARSSTLCRGSIMS
jgi:NAD(P)-dependent dehydrogenase (short-subunit alcohol dehydrogenase family)